MPNSRNYTRRRVLSIAIATAASPASVLSLDAGGLSDRRIVAESRFDVTSAPLQAEVVQLVVDFPPGAWTSWHTHGGQAINLVLEGEITLRHAGMEHPHRAGQAWTDSSGEVHAAGNTVRSEVSSVRSACRNGDRAAGGRPRFRLARATRVRRLYGKHRHSWRSHLPDRRRAQGLPGGGGLVGARWHPGWRGEQVGGHGPRLHHLFVAERHWPVARLADLRRCGASNHAGGLSGPFIARRYEIRR